MERSALFRGTRPHALAFAIGAVFWIAANVLHNLDGSVPPMVVYLFLIVGTLLPGVAFLSGREWQTVGMVRGGAVAAGAALLLTGLAYLFGGFLLRIAGFQWLITVGLFAGLVAFGVGLVRSSKPATFSVWIRRAPLIGGGAALAVWLVAGAFGAYPYLAFYLIGVVWIALALGLWQLPEPVPATD